MMAVFPQPSKGHKECSRRLARAEVYIWYPRGVDPNGQRDHLEAVPELLPEFRC
jgi:hypothetical protein